METSTQEEREIRAARSQSLFRSINENLKTVNKAFLSVSEKYVIACECADRDCVELIEIDPDEYRALRADPRRFVVRPGHVYPEVEMVVRESEQYVVVEKGGAAGELAELLGAGQLVAMTS